MYPNKLLITMIFKNSDRKNAKIKYKTWDTKNIDDILDSNKALWGVPDDAIILELGMGEKLNKQYREKYNLP
jgi:hypothetical protein